MFLPVDALGTAVSEFAFELALCAHLEERREWLLARQLGGGVAEPGGRVLDVVGVVPGPQFDDRVALTADAIPTAAIESAVGPGRARFPPEAFDCHPARARRATERAIEAGFFEVERRNGREYVRQVARYPDWIGRLVGIENKPDLGRPGDLREQLRTDVSLAVVDEAILATESHVTRAHLNRLPDPVGVWRFDPDERTIEVIREPTPLPVDGAGIEPLDRRPGRTDLAVVTGAEKARARRRIAERAYGKGWRTFELPACRACEPAAADGPTLPHCTWKGRLVDPERECGPTCAGHEPAPAPDVDLESERERLTPWIADPTGRRRRQSGLDRFG